MLEKNSNAESNVTSAIHEAGFSKYEYPLLGRTESRTRPGHVHHRILRILIERYSRRGRLISLEARRARASSIISWPRRRRRSRQRLAAITISTSVTTFKIPRVFCIHNRRGPVDVTDTPRCATRDERTNAARHRGYAYTAHATYHGRRRLLNATPQVIW